MDTRVGLHPMSPLGLTTTGRAPFSSVVEPGLHGGRHVRLPALARGSHFRLGLGRVHRLGAEPTAPQTLKALLLSTWGKGAELLAPTTPYPSAAATRLSIPFGRSPDRTLHLWPVTLAARTRLAATRRRLIARRRPRPMPHLARLPSPPADDVVLKMRRQNQPSQPHPDTPLTRHADVAHPARGPASQRRTE